MRSGRPQALKSAMFASFTFFIQTVSMLGKDTGYFMGKDYMTQEGDKAMKKAMAEGADTVGKFFSVSLQASVTPTVELDPETGKPELSPQDVCPLHLNAYQQFYKGALFKSALILIGVTLWYQGIYHAFVFTRIQYYVCSMFNKLSGGRVFAEIEWEWGIEVKVLYEAKMIDTRTKNEKRADRKNRLKEDAELWVPSKDAVVHGPSAVMLNFHTCGILFTQTRDIQESKEKAARVRARAQFKLVDADGGGTLDGEELGDLLKSMGLQHLALDDIGGAPGSGITKLFAQAERDQGTVFEKHNDAGEEDENGETVMTEDQFVQWWMSLKKKKDKGCCEGGIAAFFKKDAGAFRPTGCVRGECIVEALDSEENELERILWARKEDEQREKYEKIHGEGSYKMSNPPPHDAPRVIPEIASADSESSYVPEVWFEGDELRCMCQTCGKQPWHDRHLGEPPSDGMQCKCDTPMGSTLSDFQKDIAIYAGVYPLFTVEEIEEDIRLADLLDEGKMEARIAEIKQVFHSVDTDRDGALSRVEIKKLLTDMMGIEPTGPHLDEVWAIMDSDSDGSITEDEFRNWWEKNIMKDKREKYGGGDGVATLVKIMKEKLKATKEGQKLAMERVRVQQLDPLGPSSINTTFDVLPLGYGTRSRSEKMKRWGLPEGRTLDSVRFTEVELETRSEDMQKALLGKAMHRKQVRERDTKAGLKVRAKLQGAFSGSGEPPSVAHHNCSGLALETLINLKNLDNNSRFFRAVFMLAATVLFYPVVQSTLPVITCFPFSTFQYWDTKAKCANGISLCPQWKQQAFASETEMMANKSEVVYYLTADMAEKCEGWPFRRSAIVAVCVLSACMLCPIAAFFKIREQKHAEEGMAARAAKKEGREVREKNKMGFCQNLFMGSHRQQTRRESIAFEKRILRDPFSSLYGMCEQRAYYWFIVDLMRKAAVTIIYTFLGDQRMYVLLIFFVLFAINHDIAQPYRGRTENLFAFITLMFIIILIHTATIVTYGSMLPMIMAATCVAGVFVIFFFSFIFAKKAAAEELAAEERIKRKAQDLWGEIASKVLGMEPSQSTEDDMKAAFAVFDAQTGNASSEEEEDEDSDGEGEIDIKELIAFTDDERKLHGVTPLYGFHADRDEIDAMAMEADLDGEGKIDYDEFVAVIFSSWERKQQTDNLKTWLYKNYKRTGDNTIGVNAKHKKKGVHAKYMKAHPMHETNALVKDLFMFNGLVDSLGELSEKMDTNNHHWHETPRRFRLDLKGLNVLGLADAPPKYTTHTDAEGNEHQVHDYEKELDKLVAALEDNGLDHKEPHKLPGGKEEPAEGSVEKFVHLIKEGKVGHAFNMATVIEILKLPKAQETVGTAKEAFERALGGEWQALYEIEVAEKEFKEGDGDGAPETVGDIRRKSLMERETHIRERLKTRGKHLKNLPGASFEAPDQGGSEHMGFATESETESDEEEKLLQDPTPGQSKESLAAQLAAVRDLSPDSVPERP